MARILVVDDDPDLRDLVAFSLEADAHEILLAEDGLDAWEQLAATQVHLAIVDRMMPRLDGLALVTRCRAHHTLHDLPIIMLTARALTGEIELGLNTGVDRYVTKPFSPRELRAITRELLEAAGS